MRIEVVGDTTITSQVRTYAEYRVFAALVQSAGTRNARCARVVVRPVKPGCAGSAVVCTVTVLFDAEKVRVRATGDHPYAAINRAVERLRGATEPGAFHIEPTLSR
jgi:ribosome-associated translation inhibitor RaiA